MYCKKLFAGVLYYYMISILTIYCFLANILANIVTNLCNLTCKGLPGVFYTIAAFGSSCLWSASGTLLLAKLPIVNNGNHLTIFFIWNSAIFLPWIFLCCKKSKSPGSLYRRVGLAGIFAQIFFLAGITILAMDGCLRENLDYISRYCGCLLLLYIEPGFMLTLLAVALKNARWQYRAISLPFAIVISALFFFFAGIAALRVSA